MADSTVSAEQGVTLAAPVDLGQLLDDIVAFVGKYVVLTKEQLDVIALWVVHSHAVDGAYQTPYLNLTSAEKQCGKTRLLELLELIAAKSIFTADQSAAAIYRIIAKLGAPTLLMDEVDALWNGSGEKAESMRGIINAGNRRGATVLRVENFTEVVEYPVFGPKVLAGIGMLPETIADRSIPIKMKRRTRDEHISRFRRRHVEKPAGELDARISAWAKMHVESLREAEVDLPDEFSDRQQDASEPLLAIADMAGDMWAERARKSLLVLLTDEPSAPVESLQLKCLSDCRDVLRLHHKDFKMHSFELVSYLKELEESPWEERNLSQNTLAWYLGHYDIKSKKVRIGDFVLQGYSVDDFRDAWNRYLPA